MQSIRGKPNSRNAFPERAFSRERGASKPNRAATPEALVRLAKVFTAVLLGLATASANGAQDPAPREAAIKSVYLLKFPQYVSWPDTAFESETSPLVIGVLKDGAVADATERLASRTTAKHRKIVVKRFNSVNEIESCHILFIPRSVDRRLQTEAIVRTRNSPVLLVGERGGFASAGGVLNFYLDPDTTVGFELNPEATAQRGLRIEAGLLRLAKVVNTKQPSEER